MSSLLRPLFDGPIDIVGDVHGESQALDDLIERLGYYGDGRHPKGRRLVFVGDLGDRGPDSPGVFRRVMDWVSAGRAQCILGNHELNLLRGSTKKGNGWFFEEDHDRSQGRYLDTVPASDADRKDILAFSAELPVALERPSLRVVHACWDSKSIGLLSQRKEPAVHLLREYDKHLDATAPEGYASARSLVYPLLEQEVPFSLEELNEEQRTHAGVLALQEARKQRDNPIRVVTSGYEEVAKVAFWASGRWRLTQRVSWWDRSEEETTVIVGHYWRSPPGSVVRHEGKPDGFGPTAPAEFSGRFKHVLCVDFSVGARSGSGKPGDRDVRRGALGAWRSDTGEVVFDREGV